MSAAAVSHHTVTTSQHPGGHLQVACSGCGWSTTRNNAGSAQVVHDAHSALSKAQFGGGEQATGSNHRR